MAVLAVHDRPCCECVHARQLGDDGYAENLLGQFLTVGVRRSWICRKHLMAITADMLVTYKVGEDADHGGLCFVAKEVA